MASLPLEVDEVLEQEYEALHGKPGALPGAEYLDGDILDPAWAAACLRACEFPDGDTRAILNDIVLNDHDGAKLQKLTKSPAISEKGLQLIEIYTSDLDSPMVRRRIVDEALCGAVRALRDVRLGALYATLHAKPNAEARSALCISGGGIRSATFALGVIQGLASAGILNKFHYLSTVSGGGYIGSWLSSWARRHPRGITGVQDDLVRADTGIREQVPVDPKATKPARELPETKVDPEPQPLRHLRDYSNYLSPKLGIFSADSWTLASLYLRNLMLNLLVLVPVLAAILALPRLFENLLHWRRAFDAWDFGATLLALAVGFAYIGAARPVRHGRESDTNWLNTNSLFFLLCVLPLTIAGFGIALFWSKASHDKALLKAGEPWGFAAIAVMILLPFGLYYWRYATASFAERRQSASRSGGVAALKKVALEGLGAFVGAVTAAGLLLLLAKKVFPDPLAAVPNFNALPVLDRVNIGMPIGEIYTCFAVPLILLIFFVQASIFVGLSSQFNEDNDREWWGRAGAYLLMVGVLGALAAFISVFGPVLLYRAPILLGTMGGVSGVAAALLGYSAGTPATETKKKSKSQAASGAALSLAGPLFALALMAAISLGTTVLLQLLWYDNDVTQLTKNSQFAATVSETTTSGALTQKNETGKLPVASVPVERGYQHLVRVHNTDRKDLALIFGLAVVGAFLSRFIGANRFSMHGLYRNRLIRAYLGASRYSRDPDQFTGFDENDNLQMYELRPELLWPNSFSDVCAFVQQIATNKDNKGVEQRIWEYVGSKIQRRIESDPKAIAGAVVQKVNVLMQTVDLTTGNADGSSVSLLCRNRKTLEDTFPTLKKLQPRHAPLHVVNTCLNLVGGEKLAWQQRKAESFTVSPLHCGSLYVGYRDARLYGGSDGISLGTAVTISGAAASPNQGYHSSMPLAFILTLLNVRLGSWLGNPGLPGENTYTLSNPRSNLVTLAYEAVGATNDQCPWIYLSDGGHFENLALYEMVLRRCRYIVLTDGGCDPKFTFEDLGNAVRKIRTDLGVPIDIETLDMFPRSAPGEALGSGSYVAVCRIRYSAVDGNAEDQDGTLIYLKPSVYDEKWFPRDVYNYAQESPTFPHETTADQFFSESQFESYRALGRHVVDVIRGNSKGEASLYPTMEQFVEDVQGRERLLAHRAKENVLGVAISAGTEQIAAAIDALGARPAVSVPPPAAGGPQPPKMSIKEPTAP